MVKSKELYGITKKEFLKYEEARFKLINMADPEAVRLFTGLTKEKVAFIRNNYKFYYDEWSWFAEEFGEKW